ncbi:ATP-dependent Clp protease ATP-binding subunit [Candidatus Bipolaricaulota bacterium]|nr:ATP-dependent Clp protease ATP-binding subunit [Candidatus Bipolaricaulota bacterium]
MDRLCDVCKVRPATHRIVDRRGGLARELYLCDRCYAERYGNLRSPWEFLFGGFFDDFLGDFFDRPRPRRTAVDISEWLSQPAREALSRSAEKAVERGSPHIDTEHLLLALLDTQVVQAIFRALKLSPEDVEQYIEHNAPKGEAEVKSPDLSPRLKEVLVLAAEEAQRLGHSYIGPEHLLIGLVRESEGLAGDLLRKYGLTPESLRQQVVKVVGKGAEEGRVEEPSPTPTLDKYSRDLTALARQGKLDPVIGRHEEIETVIEILSRRTKNNPVLIGEPGVGKTAIVEGLAQRIVKGEVPEILKGKRVVELDLTGLVAGTKYRGEFEERIRKVLDEVKKNQDQIILFIDEVHLLVGAGGTGEEGTMDAANILKPMLARGELHVIGATTLNEYRKRIEKDPALERRFQPVLVSEPTVEQTVEILRGLRDRLEAHHKVRITEEAITAAAELSDRYIRGRFLPDKAIDLLDQACARVRIRNTMPPLEVQEAEAKIKELQREESAAVGAKDFGRAEEIKLELKKWESKRDQALEEWKKTRAKSVPEVRMEHVAEIVSRLTGIPVSELTKEEREKLLKMEELLHQRIVGQDEAVRAVAEAVRRARAGLSDPNRPIASFLFLGPTGVGKTELAKALAWILFGDEDAIVRIDMSEYMERHAVARLIGAPPGYVGHEEGGQLTEAVRRRPYCIVLLDEIEKAHPEVFNILLQVLDDGRLTDSKGRTVDFTNTVIIATSNIGAEIIRDNLRLGPDALDYQSLKERLMGELSRYFRPEFINRIDEIIVFQALTRDQIREIVKLQLERVERRLKAQNITPKWTEALIDYLADRGYSPQFGARELRRVIQQEVEGLLARKLLAGEIAKGSVVEVDYDRSRGELVVHSLAPAASNPGKGSEGGDK